MAFRYINPGYVSLLDSDVTATEINGDYSRTGVGFSQTNSAAGVTIPQFAAGDDFWAKFDAYIPPSTLCTIQCLMPNSAKVGFRVTIPSSTTNNCVVYCHYSSNNSITITNGTAVALGIKVGAVNTFLAHIVFGNASTAQLKLWINGNYYSKSGVGMLYSANYPKTAILYSETSGVVFSNVIFSDEEISLREEAIALPALATETTMTTTGGGVYIADTVNQTLLQTLNVSSLIADYGANSTITGITLVGNPAYKTGTGITTLTSLSKVDSITTEHGTCTLAEDTTGMVFDGWAIDNTTITDLQGMQFGWKVGE